GTAPAGALLRLRLEGAESGRLRGAWAVPLAGLAPGWLVLDLPAPLGVLGETAILSARADAVPEGCFALSLDAAWTDGASAATAEGSATPPPADRALALRLWTAEPGSRFLAPPHWRWEEAGLSLPEEGVPYALPDAGWAPARALAGAVSLIGLGQEPPRALLRAEAPAPGAPPAALLHLPYLFNAGLDLLRLGAVVRQGEAAGLRLAAWVLPLDQEVTEAEGLIPAGDGAHWSGWRGFEPDGTLELALALPLALGLRGQLLVALAGPDGAPPPAESAVEITRLALQAAENVAQLGTRVALDAPLALPAPPLPAPTTPAPASPAAAPPRADATLQAVATLEAVMLNQYFPPAKPGGYRHLDMTVLSLGVGEARWPGVRFKLSLSGEKPRLEFRQAKDHPEAFTRWQGTGEDKFGPYLRLGLPEMPGWLEREGAEPRDTLLMRTLLRLLPGATANAARAAGLLPAEMAAWLEAARAFAALASTGEAVPEAEATPAEEEEKVLLNQHYAGTGDYRHLDVTVLNLRDGARHWPMVRLKLGRTAKQDSIEFRQSQGWPPAFETWQETGFDRFGPFIRLSAANLRAYHAGLSAEQDQALVVALMARLPDVMVAAGAEAGFDAAASADWREAAERLGAALAEAEETVAPASEAVENTARS
ncbi:DUF6212 domain-containing protein, partial [Roseomonas sp. GC11]|uniref:DUF6212 domain-containing protein n=1 Tax=Roseomonas sp. GC11 TaxID=2950546 RepID=UPI00210EFE2F